MLSGFEPPFIRVSADAQAAADRVRNVVRQIDPQMAMTVVTLASMIERQAGSLKPVLVHAALASSLTDVGLALAVSLGMESISSASTLATR